MGGAAPGSSTRCLQCRQRRKKCGSERPACSRCIKSGLICSGPSETNVFIHRDATNITSQSDRAALRTAYIARINQGPSTLHAEGQATRVETNDPALAAPPNPINLEALDNLLSTASTHSLYTAIADEFKPRHKVGIFGGDRVSYGNSIYSGLAICIRALIPLASLESRLLNLGIFGALAKYIGTLRGNDNLATLARSSYTLALGEFHKRLNDVLPVPPLQQRSDSSYQLVLCLCLALQLFEVIDQIGLSTGRDAHVDGALSVLQITGPEIWRLQHLRHVFSGLRGIVVRIALRRRRVTFLAEPQWLVTPFQNIEKTVVEQIHDLALKLPMLLERTDALRGYSTTPVLKDDNIESLIEDYLELRTQFHEWFRAFDEEDSGYLFWHSDAIDPENQLVPDFDPVCIPSFPLDFRLRFRNGPTAGILSHYWSFQLQLLMGLLDILSSGQTSSMADSKRPTNASNPGLDVEQFLHEAQNLARLVLETIPYLSSCLEGRIAAQSPFEIVTRYLDRFQRTADGYSLSQYERLWQLLTQR